MRGQVCPQPPILQIRKLRPREGRCLRPPRAKAKLELCSCLPAQLWGGAGVRLARVCQCMAVLEFCQHIEHDGFAHCEFGGVGVGLGSH